MKLFKYEMKKLLLNKNRLILLAVMLVVYALIGFASSVGEEEIPSKERNNALMEYNSLVAKNTGKLNMKQYEESKAHVAAAIAEYGKGEPLSYHLNRNPVLRFHFRYSSFGQRVNEYWNGIKLLQEKLTGLAALGKSDTYEYRYYKNILETEQAIGEPVFENTGLWNLFFIMFDGMFVVLLLLMVLTYFISPLFTQEVKTEMDSIVLCSEKGRREIVTAKLLSAGLTSAIITFIYLSGSFIGMLIGNGDLGGLNAPARCLEGFESTMLNITVGEAVMLGSAWLILATVVFGLALSLVSSLVKNQSAAFGLGIVILFAGIFLDSLPKQIAALLWPIVEFNFGALAMFLKIFGGSKAYNLFGTPVSYGAAAFVVCHGLGMTACLMTYMAQKKRSVV